MVNEAEPRVRRREITEADLSGVTDLLVRGFPARPRAYWERGLARMGERPPVEGCPRYGFLLDAGAGPCGVALTLFGTVDVGGGRAIRCNLSSWTVDPAYRMQAAMLIARALKRRDVTFTNISPAPHTWATIAAQGFRVYAEGQVLVAPALARSGATGRAVTDPRAWRDLPEGQLLDDHARYGCTSLVVESRGGLHPFVFLPFRIRSGRMPLPLMQLIYARDLADVSRCAGPIGRALLRHGALGLVMDGEPEPGGPPVLRRLRRARKYVKGPHPPRLGDLSYTEKVIFGP